MSDSPALRALDTYSALSTPCEGCNARNISAARACVNCGRDRTADILAPGIHFDTPFETGCVVTRSPDIDGEFFALDAEGVECSYGVQMVARIDGISS